MISTLLNLSRDNTRRDSEFSSWFELKRVFGCSSSYHGFVLKATPWSVVMTSGAVSRSRRRPRALGGGLRGAAGAAKLPRGAARAARGRWALGEPPAVPGEPEEPPSSPCGSLTRGARSVLVLVSPRKGQDCPMKTPLCIHEGRVPDGF